MRRALSLLGLALACAAAAGAEATETRFSGVVTRVTDGDTVWVQPEPAPGAPRRKRVKVRLVGLDAPERCQAHGAAAGAALAARVQGKRVTVRRRATDDHGRALGTVWLGEADVGAWLVQEGHAWSARYRGDPGPYAQQERAARAARRGVFGAAQPAIEPRVFRREHGPCEMRSSGRK